MKVSGYRLLSGYHHSWKWIETKYWLEKPVWELKKRS